MLTLNGWSFQIEVVDAEFLSVLTWASVCFIALLIAHTTHYLFKSHVSLKKICGAKK